MTRELKTSKELKAILDKELKLIRGDDRCAFGEPDHLADPDKDGCNWSEPRLCCGAGVTAGGITVEDRIQAQRVVGRARKLYNLK